MSALRNIVAAIEAIDWTQYPDACGDSADVPQALQALASSEPYSVAAQNATNDLYSRICHQGGTVYPSTEAAVPILVQLVEERLNRGIAMELLRDISVDGKGWHQLHRTRGEIPNPFKPGTTIRLCDETRIPEEEQLVARVLTEVQRHRPRIEAWRQSAESEVAALASEIIQALERRRSEFE